MLADLGALEKLFLVETPLKCWVRSKNLVNVYYGFGDAYLKIDFWFQHQNQESHCVKWCNKFSEKLSNFQELLNLLVILEELMSNGTLTEYEVFWFTDNSIAESV